jgi:PIN domain nuclease of toxin-antitoxin system
MPIRLLLDTHVLIWFAAGDRRLKPHVRSSLTDPAAEIFVSVITNWEIAVKKRRSPEYLLPGPIDDIIERAGFRRLDLEFTTPRALDALPELHGDPFDRLLAAQALHHGLRLVTGDRALRHYPVEILW